jgi:alkylation response protein AidB-like acyl-CoA dehydrogenase
MIVKQVRTFAAEEIRPRAKEFDQKGALDRELISKMAEKRYLLASLPEQCGGLGLDPVHYGFFTEEIGKACCSTRSLITVQSSLVGETLLKWGSEKHRTDLLPLIASGKRLGAFALTEPEVGTNARGVQTVYRKTSRGYMLSGRKKWTSFGEIADFFIVIAKNESQVSAFIVEHNTEGVTTRPMKGLLAGRASHIAEIVLDDVVVPTSNIVGKPGSGFPYIVGTALDHGRYSVAWGGVAVAQACIDAMVVYTRKRKQFDRRICEFQLIQGMIGDAVTKTHAARALCIRAGELRRKRDRDALIETAIAKYFASKVAMEVAANAVQVHGGNGCVDSYPVERLFREAKLLEIIEGTSQIQQQMIAMYGLREYFRP